MQEDKWIRKRVVISNCESDAFTGLRGTVICSVQEAGKTDYIVQFNNCWSFFLKKEMRLIENQKDKA